MIRWRFPQWGFVGVSLGVLLTVLLIMRSGGEGAHRNQSRSTRGLTPEISEPSQPSSTSQSVTERRVVKEGEGMVGEQHSKAAAASTSIRGIVIGPDGAPVIAASVAAYRVRGRDYSNLDIEFFKSSELVAEGGVDASGVFGLVVRPGVEHRLEVTARGLTPFMAYGARAGRFYRVHLGTGASLVGKVVHGPSREPSAGCLIHGQAGEGGVHEFLANADYDGNYAVHDLPVGPIKIVFEARDAERKMLAMSLKSGTNRRDIFLDSGQKLQGVVLDATTLRPVPTAEVSLSWNFSQSRRTNEKGHFELNNLSRSERALVHCRATGYGRAEESFTPQQVAAGPIEFRLRRGLVVTGLVESPLGQPLPGAYVAAVSHSYTGEHSAPRFDWVGEETDTQGRFNLRYLRTDSSHRLQVHAEGFALKLVPLETGEAQGGHLDIGSIRLSAPGSISGIVVDTRGDLAVGMGVALRVDLPAGLGAVTRESAAAGYLPEYLQRTDLDGRFEFVDLAPGMYTVERRGGSGGRGNDLKVDLHPGEVLTGLELVVQAGSIAGVVVDPNGDPCPEVAVHAIPVDRSHGRLNSTTGYDGSFEISGASAPVYELSTHLLKSYWADNERVLSQARIRSEPKGDLRIEIPWGARIGGFVYGPTGDAAEGALVRATSEEDGLVLMGFSNALGQYSIVVPAGKEFALTVRKRELSTDHAGVRGGDIVDLHLLP